MRILHTVQYYSPSVGGAQEVVRQISERLAARGHDVTVATSLMPERTTTSLNGVAIEEFDIRGNTVHGIEGEADRYVGFLRSGEFDVMLNYAAQQWATDLALPILGELPYATVLAPCGFSGLFLSEYADYFARLPALVAHYDRVLLHSDTYRDAQFLRSRGIDRTCLIPNGAGRDEFVDVSPGRFRERYRIPDGVPVLLSVGSHSGQKGHDLVLDAFARARVGDARLVLIGNAERTEGCLPSCKRRARRISIRSLGRKRVLLLDVPRAEVLEAYAASDLFVLGSRVECSPLVLFEAAASRTPFVSVPAGNAAEIAAWTGGGVIIPASTDPGGFVTADPGDLAREVEGLLGDPDRHASLAAAGRRAWEDGFCWEAIARQYESLYAMTVAEHETGSAVTRG